MSIILPHVTEQRKGPDSLDKRSIDISTYKYIAALRSLSPGHMHEQHFRSTWSIFSCSTGGSAMFDSFLDGSLL